MHDVERDRAKGGWPANAVEDRDYRRETLLAWINHRLEQISQVQHRLALSRTLLQRHATLLRLGAPVAETRLALRRAGLAGRRRRRPERGADRRERV